MNAHPQGLQLERITPWLASHVSGFDASREPSAVLLTGGRSNLTYAVTDAAGQRWAVRRPPLGHIMPSAHDLKREFTVLSGLAQGLFPVPQPIALCQDESVIGTPFLVMEFVDGVVVADQEEAAHLSESQTNEVSRLLVHTLADLHTLRPEELGLESFGRPQGYLSRQVKRWHEQWQLTKTREMPAMDLIGQWLTLHVDQLEPCPSGSIVHGDFRLDNAILSHRKDEIRAIVDWEMSTLGDPVADLAVMLVYWTERSDGLRSDLPVAQMLTSGPGFWSRDQLVHEYVLRTGASLDRLPFCLTLACYKLAIIMESLVYRSRAGQQLGRTTDRDEPMDQAVIALAELGTRLIEDPRVATLGS